MKAAAQAGRTGPKCRYRGRTQSRAECHARARAGHWLLGPGSGAGMRVPIAAATPVLAVFVVGPGKMRPRGEYQFGAVNSAGSVVTIGVSTTTPRLRQ